MFAKLIAASFSISFISIPCFAQKSYVCHYKAGASATWEEAGFFSKAGIEIEKSYHKKSDGPLSVSLSVGEKTSTISSASGSATLKNLNERTFLEVTAVGNIFLWTVFEKDGARPTMIFQQKAYDFLGPVAVLAAYECE